LPLLALLAGLALTFGFWNQSRAVRSRTLSSALERHSQEAQVRIETRLRSYERSLLAARSHFQATPTVTRQSFATFVAGLDLEPGMQAIGFATLVPAGEKERHQRELRAQGFPDYQIRPAGDREVTCPVIYLEPFRDRNLRALGFDMLSEAVRQEAAFRSRDSGHLGMSGKVQLVQDTGTHPGFLLYVPVYRNGAPTATLEDRRRNLLGWLYTAFRVDALMGGVLGEADSPTQGLIAPLRFGGHAWTLVTHALPGLLAGNLDNSRTILLLGSLVSFLLGMVLFLGSRQFRKIRQLNESLEWRVHERTRELAESESLFRSYVDNSPIGVFVSDEQGRCLQVNPAASAITGYSREELLAASLPDLLPPGAREELARLLHSVTRTGRVSSEFASRRKDGSPCIWSLEGVQLSPRRYMGLVTDITARRQGEEALRESEERFNTAFQFTPMALGITTLGEGRLVVVNKAFESIYGYTAEEVQGRIVQEVGIWSNPADRERVLALVQQGLSVRDFETEILRKDGSRRWVSYSGQLVTMGDTPCLLSAAVDITQRKWAEDALRDSEARLLRAERVAQVGNWELNLAERKIRASKGAEDLFGMQGEAWTLAENQALPLPEYRPALDAALAGLIERGQPYNVKFRMRRPDNGQIRHIHSVAEYDATRGVIFGVISDITEQALAEEERARLQNQLQQSQKMESLGSLAGGVAHDMNNVLGAILGMASANMEAHPLGSPAYRAFDTITQAATRSGKMVRSLLSFARQSPVEERVLDMNAILREEVAMLERTTQGRVRLELDLAENLAPVRGDAAALTHAFMNLCVNAVDAMPEGGTLTLSTRNIDRDWIEVGVDDTGTGMPREILEKAMDPFFTTKEVGKGTGLGLSLVYKTVQAHRGQVELRSEPGRGTSVRLRFPACGALLPTPEHLAEPLPKPSPRALTVLVVDDDELIRSSLLTMLEFMGHRALGAPGGEEALAQLEAGAEPDLIILDMNMPGLGGSGTLPRLRALRPALPVLLATGRVDQFASDLARAHPFVTLLSKPFGMEELRQRLEALGRS
jgi:PAS domain S-box-containing protein